MFLCPRTHPYTWPTICQSLKSLKNLLGRSWFHVQARPVNVSRSRVTWNSRREINICRENTKLIQVVKTVGLLLVEAVKLL